MNGPGKGDTVPAHTQRLIVQDYRPPPRGFGSTKLARKYQLSRKTIDHILERAKEDEDGNPVKSRGHRKRKLDESDHQKIREVLKEDQWQTQTQIANQLDTKVNQATISREFRRMKPPITHKVVADQDPVEMSDEWKESMQDFTEKKLKKIAFKKRDYEDETPIYRNEALGKGWSERGTRILRPRHYQATKYNLLMVASEQEVPYWKLTTGTTDDPKFKKFMNEAMPNMVAGHTLILDRLGRGGAKEVPDKIHYNPEVLEELKAKGSNRLILPPKGKYLNPLELLFNDLKNHYIRPKFHRDGTPMTKAEVEEIIQDYVDNVAPAKLPGFFRERANGRGAKRQKFF